MNTIYNLPLTEKKHFIQCRLCNDRVDIRNLSEVFHHDTGDCLEGMSEDNVAFLTNEINKESNPCQSTQTPKVNLRITDFLSQLVKH